MKDFSTTIIMGRLTADPETSYTRNGKSVCNFTIANNDEYKNADGEKTEIVLFLKCIARGKTGELAQKYLKKGDKVQLAGRLTPRSWEDKDNVKRTITELTVNEIVFLTPKVKAEAKNEDEKDSCVSYETNNMDIPF